jgi:hypothetical protein
VDDDLTPTDEKFERLLRRAVRELPDAPTAWQGKAAALWSRREQASPLGAAIRRIAAQLSFDSWVVSAPALGMRGARGSVRHLLFTAQGRDVDLRIAPAGDAFLLAGQVLGPDAEGRVELEDDAQADAPVRTATLDELGEFRVDGVGRGMYRLTLHLADAAIELPPIEVGESGP